MTFYNMMGYGFSQAIFKAFLTKWKEYFLKYERITKKMFYSRI